MLNLELHTDVTRDKINDREHRNEIIQFWIFTIIFLSIVTKVVCWSLSR